MAMTVLQHWGGNQKGKEQEADPRPHGVARTVEKERNAAGWKSWNTAARDRVGWRKCEGLMRLLAWRDLRLR